MAKPLKVLILETEKDRDSCRDMADAIKKEKPDWKVNIKPYREVYVSADWENKFANYDLVMMGRQVACDRFSEALTGEIH